MIEDKLFEFKKRVILLDIAEIKIKEALKEKNITKKRFKELKKIIGRLRIKVWDYYPNENPSIEKAFKLGFP